MYMIYVFVYVYVCIGICMYRYMYTHACTGPIRTIRAHYLLPSFRTVGFMLPQKPEAQLYIVDYRTSNLT